MQITRMKINGIPEPLGYRYDYLSLSWNVEDAKGTRPAGISVDVSEDPLFGTLLFHAEGPELSCAGTELDVLLKPRTRYHVRIRVTDETGDSAEETTWFETGKMDEPWTGTWIGPAEEDAFHPVFGKSFSCRKEIRSARLYVCGLGLFEAYLNGVKVSDELLTPYMTDYKKETQIITFDVTEQLRAENHLEIYLGSGWYKGRFGLSGEVFGDHFALIGELRIRYADGSEETVGTDESWQYRGSDVADSGIYDGETLNRLLWQEKENPWKPAILLDAPVALMDRLSPPVRVLEIRQPAEILHTPKGETVLDMGQNFAGWMEFDADFPAGTEIHLDFGEVLQGGNFYNDNYRTALGGFTYISDGRKETIRPHFTYFGFRYVKVTGWPGTIDLKAFRGCVISSDLERTGFFDCGLPKVNRLYENSFWGLRSNFLDVPTDCPQRDERLGWTGDAQIFAPTASYHTDTRAFYQKFLHMLRTEQKAHEGGIPAYVPAGQAFCPIAALWGDSATFMPDTLWQHYQNKAALRSAYPMMRDWVDYVGRRVRETNGNPWGLWTNDFQFGDWLALDSRTEQDMKGATPDEYVASMYYCRSLEIVAEAAKILGFPESDRYRELWQKQRDYLLDEYFTPHGHLCVTTQSAYIIAMQFDICRDKAVMAKDFAAKLKQDGFRIRAGFAGAPNFCQVLSKYGNTDLAYTFLLNEDFPSWLYAVNLGATTIWERWNSLLPDGSISGTGMNSLNHYSYGSVAEFLYAHVLGIRPSEAGFRKAILAPKPDYRLRRASGSYRSAWGEYAVSWNLREDGTVHVRLSVPFGCSATAQLPESGKEPFEVASGTWEYDYTPVRDYRKPFGPGCLLGRVFADPGAKAVLLSLVPQAAGMDNEIGHTSLVSDLFELIPQGADPDKVAAAMGALADTVTTI